MDLWAASQPGYFAPMSFMGWYSTSFDSSCCMMVSASDAKDPSASPCCSSLQQWEDHVERLPVRTQSLPEVVEVTGLRVACPKYCLGSECSDCAGAALGEHASDDAVTARDCRGHQAKGGMP